MTRPSTLGLFALCASLAGCGGSSLSGPSDDKTTPTLVSYSGSFSGIMTRSGGASAALTCTGTTSTAHTGRALTFSGLYVTGCSIEMGPFGGSGTLDGSAFTATGAYSSGGCGVITSVWTGSFSGDGRRMMLKVVLTGSDRRIPECADPLQFLGELSR